MSAANARKISPSAMLWIAVMLNIVADEALAARNCRIRQTADLVFGIYDPSSPSPLDSITSIEVRCTGNPSAGQPTFYTLYIDGGTTTSNPGDRKMDQPAVDRLDYALFKDSGRSDIWGDGSFGTSGLVQNLPSSGKANFIHTAFGRIFEAQSVMVGPYSDTLLVTIEF